MKTEVKEFNVLCCVNEEDVPVYHKVILSNKGAIKLSGHPDLKAEFYYHLMQIQQQALTSRASWYGVSYTVPTCLHFYFNLLKKKFSQYVERVNFVSELEEERYERNIDIQERIKAADNERLTNYLEKFTEMFKIKHFHNQGVYPYFTEAAFLEKNKKNMTNRISTFARQSLYKLPRFDNYTISPYVSIKPEIKNENYTFNSSIAARTYHGKWHRKGNISVDISITSSWYTKIYKKGFAVIPTDTYDNLVVLDMKQLDINKFLVEAVTKVNNNTKNYKVQKFVVSRGIKDGFWKATRKNEKRVKLNTESKNQIEREKEENSVAF